MKKLLPLAVVALVSTFAAVAAAQDLRSFKSDHYLIHTDLEKKEVVEIGRHMDKVFAEFQRRFSDFRGRRSGAMPLYLFRDQEGYLAFMRRQDIPAQNSGGMFFVSPAAQGLSTWTAGKSRGELFEVLQHEGFHQFAYEYLGRQLPVWVNEGLAQYFEDAILVGTRMKVGLTSARRLALVKDAIANDRAVPFRELLGMSYEAWGGTLNGNPTRAALLYAQSWSVAYFLVHGDDGRYQRAFVRYLKLLSEGRPSEAAFEEAFGATDLGPMERRWVAFVSEQEPDPINAATEKLQFLGAALSYMKQAGEPMPKSLDQLKIYLQERQFRLTRQSHGLQTEYSALDESMYTFTRSNGTTGTFELLAPVKDDLPPRITAQGLSPRPTLAWTRNPEGGLVQDIEYK